MTGVLSKGSGLRQDGLRFLLAGVINTGLTFLLYQAALFFMNPTAAYTLAWVAGIAYVAVVYPERVFVGGARDGWSRLGLAINYVLIYGVGVLLLKLFSMAEISPRFSVIAVMVITTGLNFVLSRWLLRRRSA